MNTTPTQETERMDKGFTIDELFNAVERCTKNGTNPELPTPTQDWRKNCNGWITVNGKKTNTYIFTEREIKSLLQRKEREVREEAVREYKKKYFGHYQDGLAIKLVYKDGEEIFTNQKMISKEMLKESEIEIPRLEFNQALYELSQALSTKNLLKVK